MLSLKKLLTVLFCIVLISQSSFGQNTIFLSNPSFEDTPKHSRTPLAWDNCGFPNESPPDIQPDSTFQVHTKALDGNTYLGMVVRDNYTWESVKGKLTSTLQAGQCYQFEIALARSLKYLSASRILLEPANYDTPTQLRIWGASSNCDLIEMLAISPLIQNDTWEKYTFQIRPHSNEIQYIVLEVYYAETTIRPYNGNLLIDDASAFVPIEQCDEALLFIPKMINNFYINEKILTRARMFPPANINKERVCELVTAIGGDYGKDALYNLALYRHQFNTKRPQWLIALDGDNDDALKKEIRLINQQIRALKIQSYIKVIELKKLPKNAENLCIRPFDDGSIGVYY